MKEKVLIKPYFESMFSCKRNVSLRSLEVLPVEIRASLDFYLKKVLALYNQKIFPVSVRPSDKSSERLILKKEENLAPFKKGDFLLLILSTEKVRYIFQTVIEEEQNKTYILKILDPRIEERYKFNKSIPVFFSYITEKTFLTFLTQDYFLVRDVNLSQLEDMENLKEVYFFDLVLNSKDQLDDFMKIISKIHSKGELIDISKRGLCVRTSDFNFPIEENSFFYVRFQMKFITRQVFKFGLLCHLRNLRQENGLFYLHLMFFLGFNLKVWEKLVEKFKILIE